MKRLTTTIFITLLFSDVDVVRAEFPSTQRQLKAYALPADTKSADISPNERFVVTDVYVKKEGMEAGENPYSDLIQLWNFKDERLVGQFSTPSPDVRLYSPPLPGGYASSPPLGLRVVRFFPDGATVAALIGHTIHLVRSSDLSESRAVQLVKPADVTEILHGKTFVTQSEIYSMELSPTGEVAAVLWVRKGKQYGKVRLYDLSTGAITASWDTPKGWISGAGLVWHPNGGLLLINIPYEQPCLNARNHPDVFALDAQTGALKREITTGLQVGEFAVSPDGRVLAVQTGCFQLTKNQDPQLRVFDLNTGKQVRNVSGREAGVRYSVSVSADGNRFLAFTGEVKIKFDWLDLTAYGHPFDETFSVWSLANYDGIVTSQPIQGLHASRLKLSSRGNFVLTYGRVSFVYELP